MKSFAFVFLNVFIFKFINALFYILTFQKIHIFLASYIYIYICFCFIIKLAFLGFFFIYICIFFFGFIFVSLPSLIDLKGRFFGPSTWSESGEHDARAIWKLQVSLKNLFFLEAACRLRRCDLRDTRRWLLIFSLRPLQVPRGCCAPSLACVNGLVLPR